MAVITRSIDVTIDTPALRQAIAAVVPHSSPDPDWPKMHRLRWSLGNEYLTVIGTDSFSAAMALVPVVDRDSGDLGCIDVLPTDAKDIARLFKPSKQALDSGTLQLRVEYTGDELTITDVAGLGIPGKSLTVAALPVDDQYPDVGQVLHEAEVRAIGYRPAAGYRSVAAGEYYRRFVAASDSYGSALSLAPTGESGSIVVTCGRSFIGVLPAQRPDDYDQEQYSKVRTAWDAQFLEVTRSQPPRKKGKPKTSVVFSSGAVDLSTWLLGPDGDSGPQKKRKTEKPDAATESEGDTE